MLKIKLILSAVTLLSLLSGACNKKPAYTSTGFEEKRYKGKYYGERPKKDKEGYASRPYIGGGYGWQRDSRN